MRFQPSAYSNTPPLGAAQLLWSGASLGDAALPVAGTPASGGGGAAAGQAIGGAIQGIFGLVGSVVGATSAKKQAEQQAVNDAKLMSQQLALTAQQTELARYQAVQAQAVAAASSVPTWVYIIGGTAIIAAGAGGFFYLRRK